MLLFCLLYYNTRTTNATNCTSHATVFCTEYLPEYYPIRLENGSSISDGTLQVFHQGTWGYVCNSGFGLEEARVVCRQLGFQGAIRPLSDSPFATQSGIIWLSSLRCEGNETTLADCSQETWGGSGCSHSNGVVGVECTAPAHPIKLVGTNISNEGTVLVSTKQ